MLEETESDSITLSILDTSLCYCLQSVRQQDFRRRLPAFGFLLGIDPDVMSIESSYVGTTLPIPVAVPKTVGDLPARNQAQLIEAHYGYQESKSFSYQLYVLPIALDSIRSAIVDQDPIPNQLILDTPKSLALEKQFFAQLLSRSCLLDLEIAKQVINTIKHAHQGQFRKSGDPFYTHPIHVAMIVLIITQNPDAVVAALLHDVIEDTPISLEGIAYQYGQKVSYLVQKLTHLDPTGKKSKLTESENQEQLKAASNADVLIIKLSDRLHNIRTIFFHNKDKRRRIAQETLDFYVPLGNDLQGLEIKIIVEELKSSCERILQNVL